MAKQFLSETCRKKEKECNDPPAMRRWQSFLPSMPTGLLVSVLLYSLNPKPISLRATSGAGLEEMFMVLIQKQQPSFPLSPSCYLSLPKIQASFTCECQDHGPVHTSTRTHPNSAACLGCYHTQILPKAIITRLLTLTYFLFVHNS